MNAAIRSCASESEHKHTSEYGRIEVVGTAAFLAACLAIVSGCAASALNTSDTAVGGTTAVGGSLASGGTTVVTSGSLMGSGGRSASSVVSGSSGGSTGLGGSNAIGGSQATGGSQAAGGSSALGGTRATSTSGNASGSSTLGGTKATSSSTQAGGTSAAAGSKARGGASAAAGSKSTGGSPAAGGNGSGGVGTAGAGPEDTAVENQSADCEVAALPDGKSLTTKISKLPDPFAKIDGKRITTKAEWHCRRQEIRKQAEKYIFGEKPTPEVVTGSVTNTKISVHVEANGKKIDFTADIVLPTKGQAPFPALISVGAKGGMGGLTMGESRILDLGVAVIYYDNYALGKEGTAEASRGKPNPGKFYDLYGGTHSAGLLMAWAWGASRMLDVLQQSGRSIIDTTGIGVTGCSRLGKGAFAIGVFDDRIALTIPQEPSTGGDPALRIMDVISGAERTDYNYNGLNWLSDNFAPFVYNNASNATKLPIDTHALIAAMAPRGVLVLENPHQTQMGAPAGHMATLAGAEVYKALGVTKNVSYHSSVADTAHCSYKTEYTDLLTKSITAFLKHQGDPPGQFQVGSGGSLKQSDWIDWQTPTLQ